MELLLVTHKYPPATGGMEKQSYELIKGLSCLTKVHTIVYEGQESRLSFFLKLEKRIKRILLANPAISMIHYNDGLLAAASLHHNSYKHLKRSVTFHGLDVVFPSRIYQKVIFPKFNKFNLVFAVSNATAIACQVRGIEGSKIEVVKNGVDVASRVLANREHIDELLTEKYRQDFSGKRLLIAIGRPVKRKGFSWFISKVLPLLEPEVIVLLIGPVQGKSSLSIRLIQSLPAFLRDKIELFLGYPSDETALRSFLKHHKPNVIRTGKLPLNEMNQLLAVADAFIMPNIEVQGDMEGFGLVCLEACMQGARVFAAASGGITDAIVDQRNGTLLPPGDEKSWAAILNKSLSGKDSSPLSAEQIIKFTTDNFSWKKMSEEYFQHFSNLNNGIKAT